MLLLQASKPSKTGTNPQSPPSRPPNTSRQASIKAQRQPKSTCILQEGLIDPWEVAKSWEVQDHGENMTSVLMVKNQSYRISVAVLPEF